MSLIARSQKQLICITPDNYKDITPLNSESYSQTRDEYAAHYFKQRFTRSNMLDLLKHHRKLTGKWLILTNVDYDHQKFKVKQV